MIEYVFHEGQRVSNNGKTGEITCKVPGNGRPESEWYFVFFDDGTEDRFQRHQLDTE